MTARDGAWPQVGVAAGIDLQGDLEEPLQPFCNRVLDAVWRHAGAALRVSVWFCEDDEIAELHGRWLDDPTPTDVISFPLETTPERTGSGGEHAHGEIVVSVATARRRAHRHCNSVRDELALYLVHGALHLAGHEDTTEDALLEMIEAERAILSSLGMSVRERH